MEQKYFREAILMQVKELMLNQDSSLPRLQEIAQQSLEASQLSQIPNDKILEFLERYPEVSGELLLTLESEDNDARTSTINHIRALLVRQNNAS
jgi:hypothetical protein